MTLPDGYRLATDDERKCLPAGALYYWGGPASTWLRVKACVPTPQEGVFAVPIPQQPVAASAGSKAADTQVGGSHYKGLAIQPAEYCQRNRLPYCEANVVKYVTRHREKNGREDIEKAIHYLQLLLEIEYPKP